MIDISSKREGPAGKLSNFTPRLFLFDGVPCACLEGPLQAFKFEDPAIQKEICMLSGREAKKRGQERNEIWQAKQVLWWMGNEYKRGSDEYQRLLDRLYDTVFQMLDFQNDLLATGDEVLTHSIGEVDPWKTVLTEHEFCSRLIKLRERLGNKSRLITEILDKIMPIPQSVPDEVNFKMDVERRLLIKKAGWYEMTIEELKNILK